MILTEKNIIKYLKAKNLIDEKPIIVKLPGGWLNPIFLVKSENKSFVVKQALSKGKEGGDYEEIYFPRERMLNEYYSMQISRTFVPEYVPRIIHEDFENFILAMDYFKDSITLEELLKNHKVSFETIKDIVDFLIKIHNQSLNNRMIELMVSHKSYWPLKYRYQYLEVKCSEKAKEKIKEFVKAFSKRKFCLVHGDYNTRNILVSKNNSINIIDYEESGYSDPAHDVGTLLGHLIIFKHFNNSVSRKQINYIFNEYINKIKFNNKEALKTSIIIHTASIILARLNGIIKYKWIPAKIKPKLKHLAETAITGNSKEIEHFL